MYIVIGGGGIAGTALAKEFVNKKHDVVVIDISREACEALYAETGAVTVVGRATDIGVLKEAGIEQADVAIGAMYRDEDNLTFALLANSFGVPQILAKMRNPDYRQAYQVAGCTAVCDMISMFRNHIIAALENPRLRVIAVLEDGAARLVSFEPPAAWITKGRTIDSLREIPVFKREAALVGVFNTRRERLILPNAEAALEVGDRLFAVVATKNMASLEKFLEAEEQEE